jgi:hypothetical protein
MGEASSLASNSVYTPDRRISTKYSTFLDGQMLEAKPRIDNYSQVEPFFDTLTNKNIFKGSPHKYKKIEKESKKKMNGSPYGLRTSLMTLDKLPEPDLHTMITIREDVEKTYADSSDDEHY